jgi:hypothetical protein
MKLTIKFDGIDRGVIYQISRDHSSGFYHNTFERAVKSFNYLHGYKYETDY